MGEWIGQLVANSPIWLIIPVICLAVVAAIVWIWFANGSVGYSKKYEWPEDKKKRLEKKAAKAKKG